jgi:ABC-type antimicrobial peptide transport system permease subunit
MLMAEVLALASTGIAIGVPGAWMLGRLVESQLYGVHGRDLATIAGAAVLIALVAGLAGFAPGRRAVRIQPMEALRWE